MSPTVRSDRSDVRQPICRDRRGAVARYDLRRRGDLGGLGVGGPGNEVYIDRPRDGRMKLLVTVKQTGGQPGGTYFVNLECAGADAPPKMLLLRDG